MWDSTNCIKRASHTSIQTFYICDEHISQVNKCDSSKPIITDLMVDVKKYKGSLPHIWEPVNKVDMNYAKRCAEAAKTSLDFGPFPETCRASMFGYSKFKINQTEQSSYVSSAPSSDKYDYNDFLKNKITNPGSMEGIYSKSMGDSNAYIISSSGKNIDSSSSMIYDLYKYIKEKILSGKVESSRTVSVIINCMNSGQIIIPRCDKVKTFDSSKDVNSDGVWDGSRRSKPSSGEESGNQDTKAATGVAR